MTTNRKRSDGPDPRARQPRSWPKSPGLALLGLALVGLIQAGCVSDGCTNCGLGNAVASGFRAVGNGVKSVASVFHHKKGCGGGGDCGCGGGSVVGGSVVGGEEGVIVEQGTPVVPMIPGSMAVPSQGTIVPPPAIESEPMNLKPLPETQQTGPPSGTTSGGASGTKSTTSRSTTPAGTSRPGYTTSLPRNSQTARGGSQADQSLSKSSNRLSVNTGFGAVVDDIAPVDLSSEVTRKAITTPTATPTSPPAAVVPAPAPAPAEKVSAADGAPTLTLPTIEAVSAFQAPGLRRFASVAPTVAGGSGPSIEGLDWLKEKGYRTLVDLRKPSEVEANFVDAVNDRGMVYISLPILANRLDPSRLARFDDLISRNENRPLFFCDSDGTRAALAWYIHQRVVAQEDGQAALSKAEELGLGAAGVKLAEDYLAAQKPRAKAALARVAQSSPTPEIKTDAPPALVPAPSQAAGHVETSPPALPDAPDPPSRNAINPAAAANFEEPNLPMLPGEDRPQASNSSRPIYRDPAAWKPVAALVLTGIGVPLAFWSRTMLSEYRHDRKRASLPGAKRRSLDGPSESDA